MRRIDLFSKLVAPLVFGLSLEFSGTTDASHIRFGAFLLIVLNAISMPIEYRCITELYQQHKEALDAKDNKEDDVVAIFGQLYKGWSSYYNHPVFLCSFAYCMIYLTVGYMLCHTLC